MRHFIHRFILAVGLALVLQLGVDRAAVAAPGKEQGSAHGQPFRTLQSEIDVVSAELRDAVASLQGHIDALMAADAEQAVLIAEIQAALASLESRVLRNEFDIAALYEWNALQDRLIEALRDELAILESRVSANEDDIAAIILADRVTQQLIDAIGQEILVLDRLIALNAGDIGDLQAQIAALELDLAAVQAALAAKQDRVAGVCAAGSSIREIRSDGSVVCQTAGAGAGSLVSATVVSSVPIPSSLVFRRSRSLTVTCPSTHTLSGGGHEVSGGNLGRGHLDRSRPGGNSWLVTVISDSVGPRTLSVYARCLRVE